MTQGIAPGETGGTVYKCQLYHTSGVSWDLNLQLISIIIFKVSDFQLYDHKDSTVFIPNTIQSMFSCFGRPNPRKLSIKGSRASPKMERGDRRNSGDIQNGLWFAGL